MQGSFLEFEERRIIEGTGMQSSCLDLEREEG